MRKIYSVSLSQPVLSWNSSYKQWHASLTSMTYKSHLYSVLSFTLSLKMSKRHILIARNWENDCITTRFQTYCNTSFSISWTGMGTLNVVYNSYIKFYYTCKGRSVVPCLLANFCTPTWRAVATRVAFTQWLVSVNPRVEPRFGAHQGFCRVTGTSLTVGWKERWCRVCSVPFHTSTHSLGNGLEKQPDRC